MSLSVSNPVTCLLSALPGDTHTVVRYYHQGCTSQSLTSPRPHGGCGSPSWDRGLDASSLARFDLRVLGAGGLLVPRLPRCHLMKAEGGVMELFLFPWGWGVLCKGQHRLVGGAV